MLFNSGESANSNVILVAPVKDLMLRSVYSDTPNVYRQWKVINQNSFDVEISWTLQNSTQNGIHTATPGESFIITQTVTGTNEVSISWYDDEMVLHTDNKSSTGKTCSGHKDNALARNETA